jgi:ABC-2 type transport system permease protein
VTRWMAWRLHWRGLIGFAAGGFLFSVFYGAAFLQAAGTTAASQAAFGRSVSLVAHQFEFIVPLPVHPETLGGYEQYKWLAGATIMMMIWAALAGVGVGRGDEERGITEQWIAGGVSRARLLLARSGAFGLVLLVACVASVLGISAIAPAVHQDPNVAGELLKALSMAAGLLTCYAVALVVSQLPADRQTAAALGIGAPILLLIVNGIADATDSASWVGLVSPFHWMEKTSSAAPGGTFDLSATLGLAVAAAALIGVSVAIFLRRDVGAGLFTRRRRIHPAVSVASHNPMLRQPFTESLWEQRIGLAAWVCSTLVLGAVMVSVTRSAADALYSDPRLAAALQRAAPGPEYASLLGFIWFGLALLLLAGYAVVQVARWASQDRDGRVEMLLSTPISRWRVIVDRALEFAVASLLIVSGGYIGVAASLPFSRLPVDPGGVLAASLLLWPFALAFGGLGVAVASRWPRIAVPFLAVFAVVEYFFGDLAPLFKAPDWVANLSVFHLYGNPIVGATSRGAAISMLVVFLVGFAAAVVLMQQRDVASV